MTKIILAITVVLSLAMVGPVSSAQPQTRVISGDYGKKFVKPQLRNKKFGTTIRDDYGGYISQYIAMYRAERKKGTRYIIDGPCASACTVILGIIPRDRVCVTSKAAMGFHSGYVWWFGKWHSVADTKLMWSFYPANVRADLIHFFGWDGGAGQKHLDMMWLRAGRYYDACGTPMLRKLRQIRAGHA